MQKSYVYSWKWHLQSAKLLGKHPFLRKKLCEGSVLCCRLLSCRKTLVNKMSHQAHCGVTPKKMCPWAGGIKRGGGSQRHSRRGFIINKRYHIPRAPHVAQWSRICLPKQETWEMWIWPSGWEEKAPWSRNCQLTPVLLPGKSHGQRTLAGYSPWGHRVGHNWACMLPNWISSTIAIFITGDRYLWRLKGLTKFLLEWGSRDCR